VPSRPAVPKPVPAGTPPVGTSPSGAPPAGAAPGEYVIEVPAEDMNLAQLAELAKKVVERKPP